MSAVREIVFAKEAEPFLRGLWRLVRTFLVRRDEALVEQIAERVAERVEVWPRKVDGRRAVDFEGLCELFSLGRPSRAKKARWLDAGKIPPPDTKIGRKDLWVVAKAETWFSAQESKEREGVLFLR